MQKWNVLNLKKASWFYLKPQNLAKNNLDIILNSMSILALWPTNIFFKISGRISLLTWTIRNGSLNQLGYFSTSPNGCLRINFHNEVVFAGLKVTTEEKIHVDVMVKYIHIDHMIWYRHLYESPRLWRKSSINYRYMY